MNTTISFLFPLNLTDDEVAAFLAAAGITNFTISGTSSSGNSYSMTANRALTSAEQTALVAAITASLVTVTSA